MVPHGERFDTILLGVKPQAITEVARASRPAAGPEVTLFSILAGVDLAVLAGQFRAPVGWCASCANLAAALGKSPASLASHDLDDAVREEIKAFLAPLGTPEWIDEAEFDLVTALAGSGPAFVYRFIDALAVAARPTSGLEEDKAKRLAPGHGRGGPRRWRQPRRCHKANSLAG